MACSHPFLFDPFRKGHKNRYYSFNQLYFPCGWCLNCRVDKSNSLRDRCEYEFIDKKCGAFVTLTYDDRNLLKCMHYDTQDKHLVASLSKHECHKFLYRLNKEVKKQPNSLLCNHKYKYLIVGEYGQHGDNPVLVGRPHFHLLVFGLDFAFCQKIFQKAWQNQGNIMVGNIGDGAISYVLKYLDKQVFGEPARIKYDYHNQERPFQFHSLGLGRGLYDSQKDYIIKNHYNYRWHGKDVPVPPYWKNKLYRSSESPLAMRLRNISKLSKSFYYDMERKPKDLYDLKEWSINKALIRERNIKINLHKHGKPVNEIPHYHKDTVNKILSNYDFYNSDSFNRLNIPPVDVPSLVKQAHEIVNKRISWQKKAIQSCISTDPIPF